MHNQPSRHSKMLDLLKDYQLCPSVELQNDLIRLNAGLVRKVTYRLCQQCNCSLSELETIGYDGLLRAIETFDFDLGLEFNTFALPFIREEVLSYIRHGCAPKNLDGGEFDQASNSERQFWNQLSHVIKLLVFVPLLGVSRV